MRLRPLVVWQLVSVLLVLMLVAACGGAGAPASGATKEDIKIGYLGDLSGPSSATLIPFYKGIKDYFSMVNDRGGVNGRKVNFIAEDDKYAVDAALANFKKLATGDKVLAIMGVAGSDQLSALFPLIDEQKIPLLGPPFTVSSQLSPFRPYVFSLITSYKDQGAVMLDYALEQLKSQGKTPRIGILALDVVSGQEFVRDMRALLSAKGMEPVAEAVAKIGATDNTPQVQQFKTANANFILDHANIPSATVFLKDAAKYGLDVGVVAMSGAVGEAIYEGAGDAAKKFTSVHVVNPSYFESPGLAELRDAAKKYGSEKESAAPFYVYGWVDGMVMTEALSRAGGDLSREKLVKSLESIKDFDTKGISGPITFGPDNHYGMRYVRMFGYDWNAKKLMAVSDWKVASGS